MNPDSLAAWKKAGYGSYPQVLMDYDGSGNLIYIGIGARSAATSAASWLIWKLAYDGSSQLISRKTSLENSIWDNRTTETYG